MGEICPKSIQKQYIAWNLQKTIFFGMVIGFKPLLMSLSARKFVLAPKNIEKKYKKIAKKLNCVKIVCAVFENQLMWRWKCVLASLATSHLQYILLNTKHVIVGLKMVKMAQQYMII